MPDPSLPAPDAPASPMVTAGHPTPEHSGEQAHPIDLSKPMALRAEMARQGLVFWQLLPYEDLARGHVDPLDDREMKAAVRRFMGRIWQAALRAERADIARNEALR